LQFGEGTNVPGATNLQHPLARQPDNGPTENRFQMHQVSLDWRYEGKGDKRWWLFVGQEFR